MDNAVLVTGGAGYIGSFTVKRLLEDGRKVIVLDDYSTGHSEVISLFSKVYGTEQFAFEEATLLDRERLERIFNKNAIIGIIDFAAKSLVEESQNQPQEYFENNVIGFYNLVMAANGIPIVKSSTAATYGEPEKNDIPLTEDYQERVIKEGKYQQSQLSGTDVSFETLLQWYKSKISANNSELALEEREVELLKIPKNVYGFTKLIDEIILSKISRLSETRFTALRYFNAAGADSSRLIGEDHNPETHLIPLVLQAALGKRQYVSVFGDDYDTEDGTPVRDYISVDDLADAHILCLEYLIKGGEGETFNLGRGKGFSVREIIETARRITGRVISEEIFPRRLGDPAILISDAERIYNKLGWRAQISLDEMIESAWHWHRLHPEGFRITCETRYSPFWGRAVNISAERDTRPWRGEVQELSEEEEKAYEPDCYLCPGNKRAGNKVNPNYKGTWSFLNDFPTLKPDTYEANFQGGSYSVRPSRGICEVIVYSPDHSKRLSTMEIAEIRSVVDKWAETYERLGSKSEIRYVLIFENRGSIMGNSQPHPHGQVYAFSEIPDLMIKQQIREFKQYRERTGNCFVCDANVFETDDGRRIIADNKSFVAYVPYAAMLPYDTAVVPLAHIAHIAELDESGRNDLSFILKETLCGLDNLFGIPYHYSMALIQAPSDGKDYGYHMQIHITSLLRGPGIRKHIVGADIYGMIINPTDPNHTAAEIKHAMGK